MLLKLKEVSCSYNSKKIVLSIEELEIQNNELVFFIGASGVGKSTLLETLGLMNNTVKWHSYSNFDYLFNGKPVDYTTVWESNSEKNIYRKHFFSFIFQDDNLFESMSVIENAISARIIQSDEIDFTYKRALILCSSFLKELWNNECDASNKLIDESLSEIEKVKFLNSISYQELSIFKKLKSRHIVHLSGGQKQRLSFIRAVISDYKLLFADEPTGNLDMKKADEVIGFLKKHLKSRSAIIVSHDLRLAALFGDRIVLIQKKEKNQQNLGVINSDSIFHKEDDKWVLDNKKLDNETFINHLESQL
tara:strand:+ start:1122 stop:2039 length:918 start_codon:yes stop_codon:yes gene_type:complete